MWNRNPNVFWGGVLVIVGVLFLLANLNVLQNVTWDLVWPVFLIALGVWLVAARIGPGGASMDVDTSEPRDGMDRAKLEVVVGAGRLEVRAAPLDEQLYRVHIDHGGATPEVRLDRGSGTLRISQRVEWFMGARRLHVDARLTDAIPWEVICTTGAIRADFDFSSAKLTGFGCRTGASTVDLALGAPKGIVPVRVDGGAVTVQITGAAIQLRADGNPRQDGLGSKMWKSEGFDAAADRYDVTISGGALNVTVTGR